MFSFKLTETSKRQLTLRFFLKQNPSLIFSTMTALLCSASLKSLLLLLGYKGSVLRQLCYVTRIVTFQKTVLKMWMNSWLERESLFMPTVRRELRCCKTSPKFPSSLGCRQQSPASVHTASWTNSKTPSLAASLAWAKPHSVQLSSAAGWDSKQQNPDYREKGRGQT